jgi:hypothetical protein
VAVDAIRQLDGVQSKTGPKLTALANSEVARHGRRRRALLLRCGAMKKFGSTRGRDQMREGAAEFTAHLPLPIISKMRYMRACLGASKS